MPQRIAPPKGRGCHQERLTTPIPSRLRRDTSGDVLVALSSGFAGKKPEHREVAQDLGFSRWGDQVLGHRLDRSFMGKVDEISHMVTVTCFSEVITITGLLAEYRTAAPYRRIPGTSWPSLAAPEPKRPNGLEAVVKRVYPMILNEEQLTGSIYELDNEEYVQVESGPDGGVVVWSSTLGLDATLAHWRRTLGEPSTDDDGFLIHSKGAEEISSRNAETIALRQPRDVHLVVAVHGEARISWREPQIKLRGGEVSYVELCYSAAQVRWTTVRDLMRLTASEGIRKSITNLRAPIMRSLGSRAIA